MNEVTAHTADIEIDLTGNGSVVLGGVDVSKFVKGFVLDAEVGEVTQLSLDLVLMRGAVFKGGAVVAVSYETAAFLEGLGWTPPATEDDHAPPA